MKNLVRTLIAISVFLSGVALVPFMGLPSEGFNWQRYADAYNPSALDVNHTSGSPGSFFTISGINFSADTMVSIYANGTPLGDLQVSGSGDFQFLINSSGADTGFYLIEVVGNESAATQIILNADEPLWPQENEGSVFNLPVGIAEQLIFMPVILK